MKFVYNIRSKTSDKNFGQSRNLYLDFKKRKYSIFLSLSDDKHLQSLQLLFRYE